MKITYLAHASFLLTTQSETRIVIDPLDPEGYPGQLGYRAFNEPADIVTISHGHADHEGTSVVQGNPKIIRGNGKFESGGIEFLGVGTFHDKSQGAERGENTVFVITADGLKIAHMGDLGHLLTAEQAAEIGPVDVALIPVGGFFTIDSSEADSVAQQIEAKIVIPMHYKTPKCGFPIAGVEEFVEGKDNVSRPGASELEVTHDTLPTVQRIVVLEPAL